MEEEEFSIMTSLDPTHWLAACAEGFDLYTDHKTFIFIFDPMSILPDLSQRSMKKVLR